MCPKSISVIHGFALISQGQQHDSILFADISHQLSCEDSCLFLFIFHISRNCTAGGRYHISYVMRKGGNITTDDIRTSEMAEVTKTSTASNCIAHNVYHVRDVETEAVIISPFRSPTRWRYQPIITFLISAGWSEA